MVGKVAAIIRRVRSSGSIAGAAGTALRNPWKAWAYVRRSGSSKWRAALFGNGEEYERLTHELLDSGLLEQLGARIATKFANLGGTTARGKRYTPGAMLTVQASILYALIRLKRPEIIIETGVCNGLSSTVILTALAKNGSGHLHSIDLPEFTGPRGAEQQFWKGKGGAVVPEDEGSGWLVPGELRGRWTLHLGKTSELLPPLLESVDRLDLFIHDSEHSFENQLFEFRSAFARLGPGGLLFASDINWSSAFDVFAKEVRRSADRYFVDYSLGIISRR